MIAGDIQLYTNAHTLTHMHTYTLSDGGAEGESGRRHTHPDTFTLPTTTEEGEEGREGYGWEGEAEDREEGGRGDGEWEGKRGRGKERKERYTLKGWKGGGRSERGNNWVNGCTG